MNSVILAGPCGFQIQLRIEAFIEHHSELVPGGKPFPDISAAFLEVADRQINQLCCGLLSRERASGLDRFANDPVQTFNRVRRVDDLADRGVEGKERDHLLPFAPPGRGDRGVFSGPFLLKRIQFGGSLIGGRCPVNPAQTSGHGFTVLPSTKVQRLAHQMDDAGLDGGVREGGGDGVREALETVNHRDQDVLHPPVL